MSSVTAGRFALATQQVAGMFQLAGGISAKKAADAYAQVAREAGEIASQKFLRRTVKAGGTRTMKAIAGNVSPWQGSPRDVQLDALQDDSSDAAMLALGYEIAARSAEAEGKASLIQGSIGFAATMVSSFLTAHKAGAFKHGIIRGILGLPPGAQKVRTPSTTPPSVPTLMTGSAIRPMPPRSTLDPGAFATGTWGTS
jgi:hypothetical protein